MPFKEETEKYTVKDTFTVYQDTGLTSRGVSPDDSIPCASCLLDRKCLT